jgi:4-hydroxy-4-methyl-2-oxoglutarate aldolase
MLEIAKEVVAALAELDSCTVSNVIDELDVRLRNQGFCDGTIRCMLPQMAPVCGYAVTCTVRTADTPMEGHRYPDRTDWWDFIRKQPGPRIAVLEDIDDHPGTGAFVGEIHGNILRALGCIACVTNGAVRSLPEAERIGLQLFATSVVVSHAFAHVTSYGRPAVVGGLEIHSGDLLHGDRHGVLKIPKAVAAQILEKAEQVIRNRREIIDYCRSRNMSLEKLRKLVDGQNWNQEDDSTR